MYVVGNLPRLEYLDDVKITDAQRAIAKNHTDVYSINGGASIEYMEHFSSSTNILTFLKYEAKHQPRLRKGGFVSSKLPSRSKPSVKI